MSSPQQLRTTATDLLKIKHPVLLAGMNVAAGPKLAAAVTNAGGLGVIGGVRKNMETHTCVGLVLMCAGWIYPRYAPGTGRRAQKLSQRQKCSIWCRSSPASSRRECKKDKVRDGCRHMAQAVADGLLATTIPRASSTS